MSAEGGAAPEPQDRPLPLPDSDELNSLVKNAANRVIYGYLYDRREDPPKRVAIEVYVEQVLGRRSSQDQRRSRELYDTFQIDKIKDGRAPLYKLVGWSKVKKQEYPKVSRRLRAEVLQFGRCQMCGKTATDDGVKLDVDHKVPQSWGGDNDRENLQALCQECNQGKKNHFSSMSPDVDKIKLAIQEDEPVKRIGELLEAFDGDWVSGTLIEVVASVKQYQEDWQRRARDLRTLGWDIPKPQRRKEGKRTRVHYCALTWQPWPENETAAQAVVRIAAEKKAAKSSNEN